MSQTQDYVALEWVRKEIAVTLKDAKQALERFITSPEDLSQLEFCLSWLHQVHGTLHMVEFHGAALLAKEMEGLIQAMLTGKVPTSEANLAVLLQAILQLPHYLEDLQSGQPDSPLVLLPLINELLAAQQKSLLSETALFNPDLSSLQSSLKPVPVQAFANDNFIELADKLRRLYQIALLGLLKGEQLPDNCGYAQKVIARLQSFTKRTPLGPYLQLQSALFAALANDYLSLSPGLKKQFRLLDQLLKELVDNPASRIQQPPSEEDYRALIYYLATIDQADTTIDALKEQYGITHTLLSEQQLADSRQRLQGPDQEALDRVAQALREELDQLMAEVESQKALSLNRRQAERLQQLIKPIADTLVMLGQGSLGQQGRALALRLQSEEASDPMLEQVAALLLTIDASLSQLGHREVLSQDQQQLQSAQRALVAEMVQQMEGCKERLTHYIANPDQPELLSDLPHQLRQDSKSVAMAGLMQPADLLQGLAYYIEQSLGKDRLPDIERLNHLADVVMTLEYYFERFHQDGGTHLQFLLDRAEEHLQSLNVDLTPPLVSSSPADIDAEQPAVNAPAPASTEEESTEAAEQPPAEVETEAADFTEAEAEAEAAERDASKQAAEPLATQTATQSLTPEVPSPSAATEDDLIDDEIIEVFLEEVAEVGETLDAWLPLLLAQSEPDAAGLVEVRRAYHTLKGSGRMVGALDIGESAWSIEQLMNQVMEGTLAYQPQQLQLAQALHQRLPALVAAFRQRHLPEPLATDLQWLAQMAQQLLQQHTITWPDAWQPLGSGEAVASESDPLTPDAQADPAVTDAQSEDEQSLDLTSDVPLLGAVDEVVELDDLDEQDDVPLLLDEAMAETSLDIPLLDEPDELPILPMESAVDEGDDELLTMFDQELQHHLQTLQDCFDDARASGDCAWTDALQRAWHTIKGSAGMSSIHNIAQLAKAAEGLIKQLRDAQIEPDWDLFNLLEDAKAHVDELNQRRLQGEWAEVDSELLYRLDLILEETLARDAESDAKVTGLGLMSLYENDSMVEVLNAETELELWYQHRNFAAIEQLSENLFTLADVSFAIELKTIYTHCQALGDACAAVCQTRADLSPEQLSVLTMGLSSLLNQFDRMAADQSVRPQIELEQNLRDLVAYLQPRLAEEVVFELDEPLAVSSASDNDEAALQDTLGEVVVPDDEDDEDDEAAVQDTQDTQGEQVEQPTDEAAPPTPSAVVAESAAPSGPDRPSLFPSEWQQPEQALAPRQQWRLAEADETFDIFLEEADDLLLDIFKQQRLWQQSQDPQPLQSLQRDLHTLKGAARMALVAPVGDLCHELETLFEYLASHPERGTTVVMQIIEGALDTVQAMIHDLQQQQACDLAEPLVAQMQRLYHDLLHGVDPVTTLASTPQVAAPSTPGFSAVPMPNWWPEHVHSDAELLVIFLEEAQDLCQQLSQVSKAWAISPSSDDLSDDMKRLLHTLKGGAGVAQLSLLGSFIHAVESQVITASLTPQSAQFYTWLQQTLERLSDEVTGHLLPAAPTAPAQVPTAQDPQDSQQAPEVASTASNADKLSSFTTQVSTPQETVRVPANLLESLVNLAGETSISRARLEQQVTDFGYTLGEVDSTLKRLREQVRRLDRETEAQVQFRQEKAMEAEEQGGEGFDPLEFDRYSTIQQLSRALVESASDLLDLKTTLVDKAKDAETMLLQQSRINTELQEGLMQTRMVPFARLLPRLRRLVRQVSDELHKDVDLLVDNEEGELDRSVLDRLVAPIEHMLRNAIAHGIEDQAERQQRQKSTTGYIGIAVSREGGDVVLRISDDGRGLNPERIRAKAKERNMLADDEQLTDEQLYQLILQPGFSTAEQVTQLSGRGVGMDVVVNELKELSGNLEIQSRPDKGTTFIVRIPFTVSVNRSLMVGLGDELYAMPLNTVEAIVRVPYGNLKRHLQTQEPFYYLDQPFAIHYLATILDLEHSPVNLDDATLVPLLLSKGKLAGLGLGVFVDQLLGAREIVVKSIGPSFARVPGLSGATILGDGRVVVILDLPNLWRSEVMQLPQQSSPRMLDLKRDAALVMVVDDSVTVRKVSSRLLERSGYRVLTAKDGIDALMVLQDHRPDIFLLDIEMPRMDGFELANRIRHDEDLRSKPIIMITSRTGDKHRQRAQAIGVNQYLGKPFQESQLLAIIERLLAEQAVE